MKRVFLCLLLLGACAQSAPKAKKKSAVAEDVPQAVGEKADLVFLHGSHFDGHVWKAVIRQLPAGRAYHALDIPDRREEPGIGLMAAAELACELVARPSILVAHSYGGAIATQMVGLCPSKIKKIIFVAGLVPMPGESPFSGFTAEEQEAFAKAVDFGKGWILPKERRQFFRAMSGGWSPRRGEGPGIYPEPMAAGDERLGYDRKAWQGIPKAYVLTTEDKLVSPAAQERYMRQGHILTFRKIRSGHLPMLTHAWELAKIINELAAKGEAKAP